MDKRKRVICHVWRVPPSNSLHGQHNVCTIYMGRNSEKKKHGARTSKGKQEYLAKGQYVKAILLLARPTTHRNARPAANSMKKKTSRPSSWQRITERFPLSTSCLQRLSKKSGCYKVFYRCFPHQTGNSIYLVCYVHRAIKLSIFFKPMPNLLRTSRTILRQRHPAGVLKILDIYVTKQRTTHS